MDTLNLEYYYKKGTFEMLPDMSQMISNCIIINTYLILKQKHPSRNVMDLFLDNINLGVRARDDGFIDIQIVSEDIFKNPLLTWEKVAEECNNGNAISILEENIDKYHFILTNVLWERSPHFREYNPMKEISGLRSSHLCTFIAHDEKYFYIVEEPAVTHTYNSKYYTKYSNEILKIQKETLKDAANSYLLCYNVDIDYDNYVNLEPINLRRISSIVKVFSEGIENSQNYEYGAKAFDALIKISEKNTVKTNIQSDNMYFRTLQDNILWKICISLSKRKILRNYLNGKTMLDTVSLLDENIRLWMRLQNNYRKRFLRNDFLWDSQYSAIYSEIKQLEFSIICDLEKHFVGNK